MAKPISPGPSGKNPKAPKHGVPLTGKNPRHVDRRTPLVGKNPKGPEKRGG